MRYMMFIKHTEDYRNAVVPASLHEDMGKFIEETTKSGNFISGAGLQPSSAGTRVRLEKPQDHRDGRALCRVQGDCRRLRDHGREVARRGARVGPALHGAASEALADVRGRVRSASARGGGAAGLLAVSPSKALASTATAERERCDDDCPVSRGPPQPQGIRIQASHLNGVVDGLEGIDQSALQVIARETEEHCTIHSRFEGTSRYVGGHREVAGQHHARLGDRNRRFLALAVTSKHRRSHTSNAQNATWRTPGGPTLSPNRPSTPGRAGDRRNRA